MVNSVISGSSYKIIEWIEQFQKDGNNYINNGGYIWLYLVASAEVELVECVFECSWLILM